MPKEVESEEASAWSHCSRSFLSDMDGNSLLAGGCLGSRIDLVTGTARAAGHRAIDPVVQPVLPIALDRQ